MATTTTATGLAPASGTPTTTAPTGTAPTSTTASTTGTTTQPTTTTPSPSVPTIKFDQGIWLVVVVVVGTLLAGLIISGSRRRAKEKDPNEQAGSVIRSWIAISLVMGLLVLCAAAFLINDTSARSTLFGGLITSAGAAVAYYFSTKTAEEARAAIVDAATTMAQAGARPMAFSHRTPTPAKVGDNYAYRFGADGQPAPTYGVRSGHLPPGLTLDADGTLHGTPSSAGSYTFSIAATNALDSIASGDVVMVIALA